jgi:IS1 family transposase
LGRGNIRANGHPNGGRWRQLQCIVCGQCFYGQKAAAETIWQALKALAEGLDIRATARVFDLDPNTVERWLGQAAAHMEAVSAYLIHDLALTQVQVDELWALLGRRDDNDAGEEKQRGQRWVWAGIDPVSKLMLGYVVGDRSLECAQRLIHMIAALLAPGCVPLFISDGWSAYGTALLTHFGHWVQMPRQHKRGASPKPRWQPLSQLQYVQVVKKRVKGRVVSVSHRVIYGRLATITTALTNSVGQVINTAFIERFNLSLRQHVPALGRKVMGLAKSELGLGRQLALAQAYYNFCLPHFSLRRSLPQPLPTKGSGSCKLWQSRTPAMAADITHHVCRLEELLLFRPPPWQQPVAVAA